MKATSELMKEHEGITLMLNIMNKVSDNIQKNNALNSEHMEKIIEFLKVFADKCHHGKEEKLLFPELERNGIPKDSGPIGVMLHEHQVGRGYIKNLSDAFSKFKEGDSKALTPIADEIKKYVNLLTSHIQKENNILFPMADKVLTEKLDNELFAQYEKLEEEEIGRGKHEEFHQLLKQLKDIYLP
jgi:hemerythrin-like domain-containing protein